MNFSFNINDFIYFYFVFFNLYFPLILCLLIIILFFIFKIDFQRNFIGFLILMGLFLEIFFNIFMYFIYSDVGFPTFFINDFFVWDFASSCNKIIIFFIAFLIFWFVEDSVKLNNKWFVDNVKPYSLYFVYNKQWYSKSAINFFVRFKFIFFFIILNVLSLTLFSKDLFFICFLFEIATVCFIFLFFEQGLKNKEALLKFFVYSALNEFLFFFGISLVYLSFGILNIEILFFYVLLDQNYMFFLGLCFIIFSFLFKIGIFPFHFWVLDLYSTCSLQVILFISTIPKICYFYFLWFILRLFFCFDLFFSNSVLFFFIILLVLSILFSFIKAISEFHFFRLFAYSGIANYCFALLPYFSVESSFDIMPLFFYLYVYCFTLVGFFILMSSFFLFSKYKDFSITFSYTFFGPTRGYLLSFFFVCYLLSFSGLPFFIGFLAKASLSFFLVSQWYFWVFFFLSFANILSFFYVLRLLRIVFFDIIIDSYFSLADENWDIYKVNSSLTIQVICLFILVLSIFLFLFLFVYLF